MVSKKYGWSDGAVLEEHSKRKLKILREYFRRYLTVRCGLPRQERFRLAVVDGFAGGGRYSCGTSGSPLIFVEELRRATEHLNLTRSVQGSGPLDIECYLVLNDLDAGAIELLKQHLEPLLAAVKDECPRLHIQVIYKNQTFEELYPDLKQTLQGRYANVLFNLDQCGHSNVARETLLDIVSSFKRVEIFYTLMITALLAFLKKTDPVGLARQLNTIGVSGGSLENLEGVMTRDEWLGVGEKIVFDAFKTCAPYVSPFSINNPNGWRYWLIHFSSMYRARQVYNDVLHDNSSMQAHFGRSGLNMLSYDPRHESGSLYFFDIDDRQVARDQLVNDIPRLISITGDAMTMAEFYQGIYNATPAHSDDIHSALIESPDLEVITPSGGERRRPNTIAIGDVIRLKPQQSFFPMFFAERAGSVASGSSLKVGASSGAVLHPLPSEKDG